MTPVSLVVLVFIAGLSTTEVHPIPHTHPSPKSLCVSKISTQGCGIKIRSCSPK